MTPNRFISLASPDPDDSDTDIEPAEPTAPDNTVEDVSVDSDTEYFDALETEDDTPYFQQGAEPPPREQWEIAAPIDFFNVQEVSQIFFFRPTPYGFRQVVQHVSKHVANEIN